MSTLVDQWGSPISSKFYKSADNYSGRVPSEILRPLDPLRKLVSRQDWLTMSFLSEKLLANFAIAQSIIDAKAMASVGTAWRPVFAGLDSSWGKEATRWLVEEWYPTCSVEGRAYDFVTGLYHDSTCIDGVSDSIVILTRSEEGKGAWPMLQRVPSRQVGQRRGEDVVSEGSFKGYRMDNGVIFNRQLRPIAYRVLGEKQEEDKDIDSAHVLHVFEPRHLGQSRGLPIFAPVLESFRAIAQSEEWERQAMLIASAIGLIEYNDTGEAQSDPNDPTGTLNGGRPEIVSMWGGLVRYFKANGGGKLEQFLSNRPTAEWTEFQDRHIRMACAAANWSYNTIWKTEAVNGVGWRSELGKNKIAVADRQALLKPHAASMIGYAVSVAMQRGPNGEAPILPPYPGADKGGFLKWMFTFPPRITVDEGRDRAQRREDLRLGLVNAADVIEADGDRTYEEHVRARARQIALRRRITREVSEETGEEIDEREMQMLTANEMADTPPTEKSK